MNIANIAREVGGDQGTPYGFTLFNYAERVKGKQINSLINISKYFSKQRGLINYIPLTGISFGTDVITKIGKAKKKLEKIKGLENIAEEVVEDLASRNPSFMKRAFKYNTKRDLLSREARKYLRNQEKEKAIVESKSKKLKSA